MTEPKANKTAGKKDRPTPKRKDAIAARKVSSLAPASTKEESKEKPVDFKPIEAGTKSDFQFMQAINLLKGMDIIQSGKK